MYCCSLKPHSPQFPSGFSTEKPVTLFTKHPAKVKTLEEHLRGKVKIWKCSVS